MPESHAQRIDFVIGMVALLLIALGCLMMHGCDDDGGYGKRVCATVVSQ